MGQSKRCPVHKKITLSGQHKKIIPHCHTVKEQFTEYLSHLPYQSGNDYHIFPKENTVVFMLKEKKK